jgi:SAM-dependent methyltransferase
VTNRLPNEGTADPLPRIEETRGLDEIPEDLLPQLREAGLTGLAPLSTWTVTGTNRQNAYATHGLFRYYGKYPPPIGRRLILQHTQPGDLVLDPMCGSGTTGVECLLLGRRAAQSDVSPASVAVARAKSRWVPADEAALALAEVMAEGTPVGRGSYDWAPVGLRDPEHWFLPATTDSLRGLHRAIGRLTAGPARSLMEVCFLGTVRRVSRATTQQGRLFLDAGTAAEDARPTFERTARRAIAAVARLPDLPLVSVTQQDAREPPPPAERAQLAILHPPYFNAYRYSRINSLELAWMGVHAKDVREREVREYFKIGKPENAANYVRDMDAVMAAATRSLRPGGFLGLMIGDTRIRGQHIPVTRSLVDAVLARGELSLEQVTLRIPKHTEATWVTSQRRVASELGARLCDYVLGFRRVAP